MATRRMLALLVLLSMALFLAGTSCVPSRQPGKSWQLPRAVKIEGGTMWFNLFPSWNSWGAAIVEGKNAALLLRDGDLVFIEDNNNVQFFVYQASDGLTLKPTFEEGRTFLAGKVISVSLEKNEDGWDWIEKASVQELAGVRFLVLPENLDAVRLPTLKKLAAANPNIGLAINTKPVLLQVLPLFKPRMLWLGETVLEADERKVFTDQKHLETLFISGNKPSSLDFLLGPPSLRRLAIVNWDVEKAGPLPKGLKGLKSLLVIDSTMKDASALADAPAGLEELSFVRCDELSDVSIFAKLPGLKTVILNYSEVLDLSVLVGLKKLRWMGLPPGISQEQFVGFIKAHPNLKVLEMVACKNVTDLAPLRDLKGLEGLILFGSYKNLDVVQEIKSLRFVAIHIDNFTGSADQVAAIEKALPDALVVPAAPMCLGSGWPLLLIPAVFLLWLLRSRLWKRPAASHHHF